MKYLNLLNDLLKNRNATLEIGEIIGVAPVNLSNFTILPNVTRDYASILHNGTLYKTSNGGLNNFLRDLLNDLQILIKSRLIASSVYKIENRYFFFTGRNLINVLGQRDYYTTDLERVITDTSSMLVNHLNSSNLHNIIKALIDLDNTDKFSSVNLYRDIVEYASLDLSKCSENDKYKVFVIRNTDYYGYFNVDKDTPLQRCEKTGYIMTGLAGGFNERYGAWTLYAEQNLIARCKLCTSRLDDDHASDYCTHCEHKVKDFMGDDIAIYQPRKHDINSYDYRPSVKFVKDDNDALPLYLGVELEVDTYTDYDEDADENCGPYSWDDHKAHADMVLQKISPNGYVYAKTDGSLNSGFEIVSHPITLENHYKMRWDSGMKALTKYSYSSHNVGTCGMHVHINRDFFGNTDESKMFGGAKIAYLLEKHWDSFVAFTRRKHHQINRWASKKDFIERYNNQVQWATNQDNSITNKTKKNLLINAFKQLYNGSKYVALNTQHSNTFELRVFRGTLKYETFIATLEFVDNLARIAKGATMLTLDKITFADIVKYKNRENLKKYWDYRKDAINFEEEQN